MIEGASATLLTTVSFDDIVLVPLCMMDLKAGNKLLCVHSQTSYLNEGVIYEIHTEFDHSICILDNDLNPENLYDEHKQSLIGDTDGKLLFVRWDSIDKEIQLMLKLKYNIKTAEEAHS